VICTSSQPWAERLVSSAASSCGLRTDS